MPTAAHADRHVLYEEAVQHPLLQIEFIEEIAQRYYHITPRTLGEDFCGTASLAAAWVSSGDDRQAIAIDIAGDVLAIAKSRHRQPLGSHASRLQLIQCDVLADDTPADCIVALNYSTFIYKTRADMLRYLKHVHQRLTPGGVLMLDMYGGPASLLQGVGGRAFETFTYEWDQAEIDPATGHVVNYIHFAFPDGSRIDEAFTYHWRLWTLPELQDLLQDAGFIDIAIWFEDDQGFTTDLPTPPQPQDDLTAPGDALAFGWVAQLTAQRGG